MKTNKIRKIKNLFKRQNFSLAAFSLIEVVTVLLVVSIGMAGTISLVTQSIRGQMINKNTLIAYQLAQEGVELVRFVRDTNFKSGEVWDLGLESGRYYMDYTMLKPEIISPSITSEAVGKLALNEDGFYISDSAGYLPEGSFSRIITISKIETGGPMTVDVNIYWFDRGQPYSYFLSTQLYDWF